MEACLGECQFKEDGYSTPQYHPLVLRALGCYFYDVDEDNLLNWKQHLLVTNKLQESRESKRVSGILGLNYFALPNIGKLVFLDVALTSDECTICFFRQGQLQRRRWYCGFPYKCDGLQMASSIYCHTAWHFSTFCREKGGNFIFFLYLTFHCSMQLV